MVFIRKPKNIMAKVYHKLVQVVYFPYLSGVYTVDGKNIRKIRKRIEPVKAAFNKNKLKRSRV